MEPDELKACQDALTDIIGVVDSYKGLAEQYKERPAEEGEQPTAALIIEEGEPPQTPSEEAAEPAAEEASEPPPMSLVSRPGAAPRKRGPGRPRKGSY